MRQQKVEINFFLRKKNVGRELICWLKMFCSHLLSSHFCYQSFFFFFLSRTFFFVAFLIFAILLFAVVKCLLQQMQLPPPSLPPLSPSSSYAPSLPNPSHRISSSYFLILALCSNSLHFD